jgi:RNA polymerase sigma-70 factor (ECF subfamily)
MRVAVDSQTEELIRRAQAGEHSAVNALFRSHRARLRRMVAIRMDPRLATRVDASDVVQEALADASKHLEDYLRKLPLPFYPWLRQIAWNRLVDLHRRHIQAQKRRATREQPWEMRFPEQSSVQLAGRLIASGTSPSRGVIRQEMRERVRSALAQLPESEREVLVLRYLEQLSIREIAAVLGTTEGAVNMRQVRALDRLRVVLDGLYEER